MRQSSFRSITVMLLILLFVRIDANGASAKYDYGWLLKCKGAEYFAHDAQFHALLDHISPVISVDLETAKQKTLLSKAVWGNMTLPGDMVVNEQRYIVLQGSQAHNAPEEALVWIDTKEDRSVCVLLHHDWKGETVGPGDNMMLVASKSYKGVNDLPKKFWTDIHDCIKSNDPENMADRTVVWRFADAKGNVVDFLPSR